MSPNRTIFPCGLDVLSWRPTFGVFTHTFQLITTTADTTRSLQTLHVAGLNLIMTNIDPGKGAFKVDVYTSGRIK